MRLNRERAAEEARGLVRYLRPSFQSPQGGEQAALEIDGGKEAAPVAEAVKQPLPKELRAQVQEVLRVLSMEGRPLTPAEVAGRFLRARSATVAKLLDTLEGLGLARKTEEGRFMA